MGSRGPNDPFAIVAPVQLCSVIVVRGRNVIITIGHVRRLDSEVFDQHVEGIPRQ